MIVLAGPPLSGKTTFARHLTQALPVATVHVENDRLRSGVAEALGRAGPTFGGQENHLTYEAARDLIDRALEAGVHVLHDATNLRQSTRADAYALADRWDAPARVVFLQASRAVREDRAHEEGPAAEQAHAALGARRPTPEACRRPCITLDGTRPPAENLRQLLGDPAFGHLVDRDAASLTGRTPKDS